MSVGSTGSNEAKDSVKECADESIYVDGIVKISSYVMLKEDKMFIIKQSDKRLSKWQ